jgi:hypothetical protein
VFSGLRFCRGPRSFQLLPETALSPIYAHAFLASTAAPFEKSVL